MPYAALQESFSLAASIPHNGQPAVPGWTRFDQIYSDIADATPLDRPFRVSLLVGELPTIAGYAPKVQREIIAVVVRDMLMLRPPADGIQRVRGGIYEWRISQR